MNRFRWISFFLLAAFSFSALAGSLNAMAPLKIKANGWADFRSDLKLVKQSGVESISVDVWWGDVQKNGPDSFDWSYYEKIFQVIREEGLKISPILSTHACGGNVGDDVNIPLPDWVWAKRKNNIPVQFLSEAGNLNSDYVSYWATDVVIEDYKSFWRAFSKHFANLKNDISELSISMGPSGELHFPAYHGHDADFNMAKWPHRGSFQAYGGLAELDFQDYLRAKYPKIKNLNRAWGTSYQDFSKIEVPFFKDSMGFSRALNSQWLQSSQGTDVMTWYHDSLLRHANLVAVEAINVFQKENGALSKKLTFKVPGVHWQEQRHAELLNGLIAPEEVSGARQAYSSMFDSLKELKNQASQGFSIYTTAAASINQAGPNPPFSRAQDLVKTFSMLSEKTGIPVKVENALSSDLYNQANLNVLEENIRSLNIQGVTLLRMGDIVDSPMAQKSCLRMLRILHGR